jgi:hypothetical protein
MDYDGGKCACAQSPRAAAATDLVIFLSFSFCCGGTSCIISEQLFCNQNYIKVIAW